MTLAGVPDFLVAFEESNTTWKVSFTCIRTKYGDLLRKSSCSVQAWEIKDEQKLYIWSIFTQLSYSVP